MRCIVGDCKAQANTVIVQSYSEKYHQINLSKGLLMLVVNVNGLLLDDLLFNPFIHVFASME